MLYQLSYLGAKSAQSERATEARVIKARFRTVQNSASLTQSSWSEANGRAEPVFQRDAVVQRQHPRRFGGLDQHARE